MSKDKTIVLMGNGPSLKDVDFSMLDGYDTFGLNSAYRAYHRREARSRGQVRARSPSSTGGPSDRGRCTGMPCTCR